MQEERRHRKVVAELLETTGVLGKIADSSRDREEPDQGEQAQHERIARQNSRIAANGTTAVRA